METQQVAKQSKYMNIALWVLQVGLAFWSITGATYMMGHYPELASTWALETLPSVFWMVLGVLEIVFAVGLVLPGIMKRWHKLTFISAVGVSIISLSSIALYIAYTGIGILWAVIPALLAGVVAYGRR